MKKIIFFWMLLFSSYCVQSQGCSDAGICSITNNVIKNDSIIKNSIQFLLSAGAGAEDVTYLGSIIGYTRFFSKKLAISLRTNFVKSSGNLGTISGLGDVFLTSNYSLEAVKSSQFSFSLGIKIPLNNSDKKLNNLIAPLDYQSSLGTLDFLCAINYKYQKWDFNVAAQIPIKNYNKNTYFKNSLNNNFVTTNLFQRQPDGLFKATYNYGIKNDKFVFKPNVLFIYHVGNDTFLDFTNKREQILNSEGLTVNANLQTIYNLNNKNSIELSLASPLLVREIRPDGLTRSFVLGLSYNYNF